MTERRTLVGIFWKNRTIGVTEEQVYSQNYHFFEDDDVQRVQVDWQGTHGNGRKGWKVGETSVVCTTNQGHEIGGGHDIVIFDNSGYCTDLDPRWIKKI